MARWIDFCDPTREQLEAALPDGLHRRALDQLLAEPEHGDEPRPTIESHGAYVFGVFLIPVADRERNEIYYQEIDIVANRELILTVRKTPPNSREPFECSALLEEHKAGKLDRVGKIAYHIVDEVAEGYLNLTDALEEEIDELEDGVEAWPHERVHERISSLRHDMLHIRRTLAPTRDALHRVMDNRIELEGQEELFTREIELNFADAYDKILRATDSLDLARDLLAGVRDYYQAKVANDQNEVMKRLAAVASLLLVPTFIVGVYGQNFRKIPELHWGFGYAWSWGVIVLTTVLQLWFFRRKEWL